MRPYRRALQAEKPDAFLKFRAVLREFRPDVVHIRMFTTQLSSVFTPLLARCSEPFASRESSYILFCPPNTRFLPHGVDCHRSG